MTEMIETEGARVFCVAGFSFGIAIPVGGWIAWLKAIQADGGCYAGDEGWIPVTSIACIVRGDTMRQLEAHAELNVIPVDLGRMN